MKNMSRKITLNLPICAVIQILDGLEQRIDAWKRTEKYLRTGYIEDDYLIEECSKPEEAKEIASFYTEIVTLIKKQLRIQ
jgi:hypothetical protein